MTKRDVTIGSVCITVDRLEAKGLVTSSRTVEAQSRRLLSVTPAGARALAGTRAVRERLREGVQLRPLLRHA